MLKLAFQVVTEPNFLAIKGGLCEIFRELWDVAPSTVVLFSPTLVDKNIFTNIIELSDSQNAHINIIEQTLFETSFIYDDIFYERQLLSPFFIPFLEILLQLFKNLNISYRLKKFTPIDHFEAIFTNKKFEIKEFGTSDKVLIFEKNSTLIESEILFLKSEAHWAEILYVLPAFNAKLIEKIEGENSFVLYKNSNEIINLLKEKNFHFALIIGASKAILNRPIVNQSEPSLFDFE